MNVLSVDWDFFWPDIGAYDWGTDEDNSLLQTYLWAVRYSQFNLMTKVPAHKSFVPDLKLVDVFWERVLRKGHSPSLLFVAESHGAMKDVMELVGDCRIWNFDQHHDLGYTPPEDREDYEQCHCGNWAWHGWIMLRAIQEYHLIYPAWRKGREERFAGDRRGALCQSVTYGLEGLDLPFFDLVFICRSPTFTAPWADDVWMRFIHYFEELKCWKTKAGQPAAWKVRRFDWDLARQIQAEVEQLTGSSINR